MTLDRHAPDGGAWLLEEPYAWRRDRLPKLVATLDRRPDALRGLVKEEVVAAGLLHALNPDDPGVGRHLRNAARAAGAAARLLRGEGGATLAVEAEDGREVAARVPAAAPPVLRFHRQEWTRGFHAAMAARDGAALEDLAAVPDAALDAALGAGMEEAPFAAPRVRALRGLRRRDAGFAPALLEWSRATDPGRLPAWAVPWALEVDAPEVGMIHALRRDAEPGEFDAALAKALERHRAYWTSTGEERNSMAGLLALGPLAQACLARDMGLRVGVRSDHLPRSVVEAATGAAQAAHGAGHPTRPAQDP